MDFKGLYSKLRLGRDPKTLDLTIKFMSLVDKKKFTQNENNIWTNPIMITADSIEYDDSRKVLTASPSPSLQKLQSSAPMVYHDVDQPLLDKFVKFKEGLEEIQESWKTDDHTGKGRPITWNFWDTYPGNTGSKEFYKLFEDDLLYSLLTIHIEMYEDLSDKTNSSEHAYYQTLSLLDTDKVILIGDIHSSLYNLLKIIEDLITKNILNINWKFNTEDYYLVFLGDIIDRGGYSLECLIIVLMLKRLNPTKVLILAGNHETLDIASHHGLKSEIFNEVDGVDGVSDISARMILGKVFKLFSYLPIVAFARYISDKKMYQLCHGGIDSDFLHVSSDLNLIGDIPTGLSKLFTFPPSPSSESIAKGINGFQWSDFTQQGRHVEESSRGIGHVYPPPATKEYLNDNNFHCIISGHQDSTNVLVLLGDTGQLENYKQSSPWDLGGKRMFTPNNIETTDPLDPNDDNILSIITSTALGPRNSGELTMSCYLELNNNNSEGQRIYIHAIKNTPFTDQGKLQNKSLTTQRFPFLKE